MREDDSVTKTATKTSMREAALRTALKEYREALSHIDIGLRNPDLYEIEVGRVERRIVTMFMDPRREVIPREAGPEIGCPFSHPSDLLYLGRPK